MYILKLVWLGIVVERKYWILKIWMWEWRRSKIIFYFKSIFFFLEKVWLNERDMLLHISMKILFLHRQKCWMSKIDEIQFHFIFKWGIIVRYVGRFHHRLEINQYNIYAMHYFICIFQSLDENVYIRIAMGWYTMC